VEFLDGVENQAQRVFPDSPAGVVSQVFLESQGFQVFLGIVVSVGSLDGVESAVTLDGAVSQGFPVTQVKLVPKATQGSLATLVSVGSQDKMDQVELLELAVTLVGVVSPVSLELADGVVSLDLKALVVFPAGAVSLASLAKTATLVVLRSTTRMILQPLHQIQDPAVSGSTLRRLTPHRNSTWMCKTTPVKI
jgi:hypothetical protein